MDEPQTHPSFAAAIQCAYEAGIIDSDVAVSNNEGITANSHCAAVEYSTEQYAESQSGLVQNPVRAASCSIKSQL